MTSPIVWFVVLSNDELSGRMVLTVLIRDRWAAPFYKYPLIIRAVNICQMHILGLNQYSRAHIPILQS
jgi:hypothetical protein